MAAKRLETGVAVIDPARSAQWGYRALFVALALLFLFLRLLPLGADPGRFQPRCNRVAKAVQKPTAPRYSPKTRAKIVSTALK